MAGYHVKNILVEVIFLNICFLKLLSVFLCVHLVVAENKNEVEALGITSMKKMLGRVTVHIV